MRSVIAGRLLCASESPIARVAADHSRSARQACRWPNLIALSTPRNDGATTRRVCKSGPQTRPASNEKTPANLPTTGSRGISVRWWSGPVKDRGTRRENFLYSFRRRLRRRADRPARLRCVRSSLRCGPGAPRRSGRTAGRGYELGARRTAPASERSAALSPRGMLRAIVGRRQPCPAPVCPALRS